MNGAFLTVAEIAEMLKVNQQTVRNWIDRDELPAVRVGARRVRVRQADLDAFIAASAAKGARPDAGDPDELRAEFADVLRRTQGQIDDDAELAASLRALADVAKRLARALERPMGSPQ